MLDNTKIARFIAEKRRAKGLTQQQVANSLNVTFQAVSKWETGATIPNVESLVELAQLLNVTVDELLKGRDAENSGLTYSKAGVNVNYTDTIKAEMEKYLSLDNPRVLNGLGPFASLYDIEFDNIKEPVLVLKSEEPGSKQKIAMDYGYTESICHDMINHLVNDIIVMGATPLAVLDTIICGKAEKETIKALVKGISEACKANECALVGGETSIQPNVVEKGTYLLTSSVAGITDKKNIIDGSKIKENDVVLAVASNGLHTNGYSLVRMLMNEIPHIKHERVDKTPFLDAIMKPHAPYYKAVKDLFGSNKINGMAHITGGGIEANLKRVMPDGLSAQIDLSKIKPLKIFSYLKSNGNISDDEMLRTFNCGVGLVVVTKKIFANYIIKHISKYYNCYEIGSITTGENKVVFENNLKW